MQASPEHRGPRLLRRLPLRARLTGAITFAILSVLGAGAAVIVHRDIGEMKARTIAEMDVAIGMLGPELAGVLAGGRALASAALNARLPALADVTGVSVYAQDGEPVFRYQRAAADRAMPVRPPAQATEFRGDQLYLSRPVSGGDGQTGTAYFRVSTTRLDRELSAYARSAALFLAAMAALSMFAAWRTQRLITRPLTDLRRLIRSAGHADRGAPWPAQRDEIGTLVDDFRRMVERTESGHAQALEEAKRLQITLDAIMDGVITTDRDGRITYMNDAAATLTRWSPGEAAGRMLCDVLVLENEITGEPLERLVQECLDGPEPARLRRLCMLDSRDGGRHTVESLCAPIRNADGEASGTVIVIHDVTQERSMTQQLSYQATHDALTGLVNRAEFTRRVQRARDSAGESGAVFGLLYMDLDQFKVVNDTCGHAAGDEMLRSLTELLRHEVRARDTLARLGGDEFGVLLDHCPLNQTLRVARELLAALRNFRFEWETHTFTIGASIGVVAITAESGTMSSIMSAADSACFMAKEGGRNRIHVYQADDNELSRRHGEMQWVSRITQAIEEDRLVLYHQTIAPVAGTDPRQHFEILVRMLDEDGKLVAPGLFLPAAERYNLSPIIDRQVVEKVFSMLSAHPARLGNLEACAINLSGHTLGDADFLQFLIRRFTHSGIPPDKICFEITETAAVGNLDAATHFIQSLKRLGCRFALDDFGSGMSSFGYLKHLPVDYLKIDGLFVKDMVDDAMDCAMVRSINEIGHTMGLKTIAEFVENRDILDKLGELGVDFAQGYGVARPQAFDWNDEYIDAGSASTNRDAARLVS